MKRFLILLAICIPFCNGLFSQVIPQTGSANFDLPMFNWTDDKSRLTSVVAISYSSANGVKVDDVPSNLGQGWSLVCGGVIKRVVMGEPDDQKGKDGSIDDITKFPPGRLYAPADASAGCNVRLVSYPIFREKNRLYRQLNDVVYDKEIDIFHFQFNGRSGSFFIGKNDNRGIVIGDSKLKVEFIERDPSISTNIRNTIVSFRIIDEDGIKYTFSTLEKTRVMDSKFTDAYTTAILQAPQFERGGVYYQAAFLKPGEPEYVVNGWHLTEVEEPLTGRKILYNYGATRQINSPAGKSISINIVKNVVTYFQAPPKKYAIVSTSRTVAEVPVLTSATYPDGYEVNLEYGSPRFDLQGDFVLSAIGIKYLSRDISKYVLRTAYFIYNRIGYPINDQQMKASRLCLVSMQKIGVDLKSTEEPHTFEYYKGSGASDDFVPPLFSPIKDIWGYYNGDHSRDEENNPINIRQDIAQMNFTALKGLSFLRTNSNDVVLNPKPGYAKNGLLKQINYPTGGSLRYEYEQNKGIIGGQSMIVGGVHVSKTILRDGGYTFDCSDNSIITDYRYVIDETVSNPVSSLWGLEAPLNKIDAENFYEPQSKYYRWGFGGGCFPLGCCKYRFIYPGIESRENAIDYKGISDFMKGLTIVLDAINVISTIIDVLSVLSGANPAILALDIYFGILNIILTCFISQSQEYESTVIYNTDLNQGNPLPMQFKRVVISNSSGGGGGNGKTIMEFTSADQYPVWHSQNNYLSGKQRAPVWAYGLPIKTTIKNKDDIIVKEEEFQYNAANINNTEAEIYQDGAPYSFPINYASCKCIIKKSSAQRVDHWLVVPTGPGNHITNTTSSNDLKADISTMRTGRLELIRKYDREYKTSGEMLETKTEFTYNKNYQPNLIKTYQSNGDISIESMVYSGDTYTYGAAEGPVLHTLVSNNILNLPVAQVKAIKKPGSTYAHLLSETVTRYSETSDGDIKPSQIYEQRLTEPVLLTSNAQLYAGGTSFLDPRYKKIQEMSYNETGKLINMKDEAGRQVSNIYDYNNKFVVASIVNADQIFSKENSAYSSFETSALGGWYVNGTAAYNNSLAITGDRSFVLSPSASLYALVSHPKPYIISFWAVSNSSINIINPSHPAVLKKSAPVINGLTYYEYEVSGILTSLTIEGNTTIDELRLYPKSARMRTVTYDPALGKTSECDENNRITYYEYDENGKLRFIKDELKNVVKMYEYNVAKAPANTACVSNQLFSNIEMSDVFRKNDCEKDYLGDEVPFTVPAGMFTSTISQDVADAQAQDYLNTQGQLNANATGNCTQMFYNVEVYGDFQKEGCDIGWVGSVVRYTVPANRYFSIISVDAANYLARLEVEANGQANANMPGVGSCIYSTTPVWEGTGQEQCSSINPGYMSYEVEDINPHSASFGVKKWEDGELTASCGGTPPAVVSVTFVNNSHSPALLTLTRLSTNQVFNLTIPAINTTSVDPIQVPTGDYSISIHLPMGTPSNSITVYSNTQTGNNYSQNPITIIGSANPIIVIN